MKPGMFESWEDLVLFVTYMIGLGVFYYALYQLTLGCTG